MFMATFMMDTVFMSLTHVATIANHAQKTARIHIMTLSVNVVIMATIFMKITAPTDMHRVVIFMVPIIQLGVLGYLIMNTVVIMEQWYV